MKKKVQMKKMAGVFLALAILGIGLFPPGNVYAAANQAPDADPVVVVLDRDMEGMIRVPDISGTEKHTRRNS